MEQQENELEQARREIDAVDAEMAALFCRRAQGGRIQAGPGPACFGRFPGGGRRGQKLRPAAGRGLR